MAIGYALDFHNLITTTRKQKRLHYLKKYWTDKCLDIPKFKLNTNTNDKNSCGISNFIIEGKEPAEIENFLFDKYKIHTVSIIWANIKGVRVTPNVYTVTSDLDKLVDGIHKLAKL
jgi:selenocysteine lyase/cysteine desulfurase